jgi:hypothetical protein
MARMSTPNDKLSREERLAAKLRENLRRRKAQARALGATDAPGGAPGDAPGALSDEPALPNSESNG